MTDKHPQRPSNEKALARWNNEGGAPKSGDLSVLTHRKRPRDPNQLAKMPIDPVAGEIEDREPTPEEQGKDPKAVKRSRLGAVKGVKRVPPALRPLNEKSARRAQ